MPHGLAVDTDDRDVEILDQDPHTQTRELTAAGDVVHLAVDSQRHRPFAVELVVAQLAATAQVDRLCGRPGLLPRRIDLGGGPAADSAMGADLVVVADEAIELDLELLLCLDRRDESWEP